MSRSIFFGYQASIPADVAWRDSSDPRRKKIFARRKNNTGVRSRLADDFSSVSADAGI